MAETVMHGGDRQPTRGRIALVASVLAVILVVACLALPFALARWHLSPDAIEHLAIANAWVHGMGFVDPEQWTYYRTGVPYPGTGLRAPVISLLAAAPLALGATLSTVMQLHAIWSSFIAGSIVLAALGFGMRLPAAVGAAILVGAAPAWLNMSTHVWTEPTAILAFMWVVVSAKGVVISVRRALFCAALTVFASFCRPNLSALALAVTVAGALQLGTRRSLRSAPLWSYVVGFFCFFFGSHALIMTATGEAPFSRYDALFQVMTTSDAWLYAKEYPGIWAFSASHWEPILARAGTALVDFATVMFLDPMYHWLGWLAVPGLAFGLVQKGDHSIARRTAALSGVGFVLVAALYTDFDRLRFPIFTATAASLCGLAALDGCARWAASRFDPRLPLRRALLLCPLLLALFPFVGGTLGNTLNASMTGWQNYQRNGTREVYDPRMGRSVSATCRHLDADALIASSRPWHFHLWCGNASIKLPTDIVQDGLLDLFLDQERPGYLIPLASTAVGDSLAASDRLRPMAAVGRIVPYALLSESDSRSTHWRAPPPLVCAGKPPMCSRQLGR